jgi:RsiW-degrading membrane proteinase PrsW (M82 family)
MDADVFAKAAVAIAPVLILLLAFDRLDVFNLIRFRTIAALTGVGALLAAVSYAANLSVMDAFPIGFTAHTRYVSPVIEELMKAAPLVFLFARNRLGFKLDAAIAGFAVGAGFSVFENLWYLREFAGANLSAWLVRGFGTAIMHGGATALFGVIAHEMAEKQMETRTARYRFNPLLFAPGLAVAILMHAGFNHFPNQPVLAAALTLFLTPATLFLTLARSERATHEWLKEDLAFHRQALDDIRAGRFEESEAGRAIHRLTDRFAGWAARDAFAFVELKTELVLRAEELILARQHDEAADVDEEDADKFARLDALRKKLGAPAIAAISPYLGFSRNDLWELARLRERALRARSSSGT